MASVPGAVPVPIRRQDGLSLGLVSTISARVIVQLILLSALLCHLDQASFFWTAQRLERA